MHDFGSRENRVRNPTSGIRQRLRVSLKQAGINTKFRTDHLRSGTLVVMSRIPITLPFLEFEGCKVEFVLINYCGSKEPAA